MKSAPRGALAVFAPFDSDSSKLGRILLAQKTPSKCLGLSGVGGPKRIRTAVAAFAELSLATRPSDPFQSGEALWACEYTSWVSLRFPFWGINSGKTGIMQGLKG